MKPLDIKEHVSTEEWQTRVDLAAAYRLVALFGWDDLVFTHLTAKVPGTEHFLINPYGFMFEEITASSLVIMPVLGMAKRRLGERLGSGATAGEGTQNLMCAAQAAGVLLALVVVAVWPGGWPIDPIIALGIAAWSVWEGNRSWRGADCC